MKILFYGGTGYLGSSIISSIKSDHEIKIITRKNLKKKKSKNIVFLNQFNDKKKILKEIVNADLFIFSNGPSFRNSKKELYQYISFFQEEIDLIKSNKIKNSKIIYFSTIHVYENNTLKKPNYASLNNSKSHYAIRNRICENILLQKFIKHKNELQILRLANIFGVAKNYKLKLTNQMFNLAINQFCLKSIKGETIHLYSSKKEKRNYVSINDFIHFFIESFINRKIKFPPIINYASNNSISNDRVLKILISEVKKLIKKTPKIRFLNKSKNSKINYNFDIKEIDQMSLRPKISIKNEIKNSLKKIYALI